MSSPSQPPSNADSVAGFDRTIPLAVEALERRARDVESVAGAGDEAAVVKAYAAARFFIVQTDGDMRVLLRAMAADPAKPATALLMPDFAKADLFKGVVLGGVLPRKTFSMGHAEEKRYYNECRSLTMPD